MQVQILQFLFETLILTFLIISTISKCKLNIGSLHNKVKKYKFTLPNSLHGSN